MKFSTLFKTIFVVLCILFPFSLLAVDDPEEMLPNPKAEARAEAIGEQLRCLVCQNESIEDSSSALARDLRKIVREHVAQGESNQHIINWMVQRYGAFIRLRPAFSSSTLLLWSVPFLAPFIGCFIAYFFYYRHKKTLPPHAPLTQEEKKRLNILIKDTHL